MGGVGTVLGCVLGALLIGLIRNALPAVDISQFWQLAISGGIILLAIIIYFSFEIKNPNPSNNFFWLSKETAVLINNWFMMYFLSVVLIGTLYPIFLEVVVNEKISVGAPFYHKLMVPFLIPFFIFMSIGPRLKWIKDNEPEVFKKIASLGNLVTTFIMYPNLARRLTIYLPKKPVPPKIVIVGDLKE